MRKNSMPLVVLVSMALFLAACAAKGTDATTGTSGAAPTAKQASLNLPKEPLKYDNINSKDKAARKYTASYKIVKETYTVDDGRMKIAIDYPQLTELSDGVRQQKINELLKKEALQVITGYEKNGLNLTIHYTIDWQGDSLLSIHYTGMGYVKGTAHPNHHFYTTNIDIGKGSKLRLADLVIIDENFANKLRDENIKTVSPHPSALSGKQIFTEFTPFKQLDETIELLKKADTAYPDGRMAVTFCYFTADALGISTEVSHAIGDHAEFELKYEDIANHIKAENEVWRDFFTGVGK